MVSGPYSIVGILLAAGESRRFGARKLLHPLADATPIGLRGARNLAGIVDKTIAVVAPGDTEIRDLLGTIYVEVHVCPESRAGMGASLACGVRASAPIAAPIHDGRRGDPVGFRREYYAQLASLSGDEGAKTIVTRARARRTRAGERSRHPP